MSAQPSLKDDCPELIARRVESSLRVLHDFYDLFSEDIQEAAKLLALAFSGEQRLFIAGMGVSSCLASVLASRLVHGTSSDRTPLPATALSCFLAAGEEAFRESAPDGVFARQLEAFAGDGDVLLLLSVDGAHPAILQAAAAAREQGMFTLALTGGDGGELARGDLLDLELRVPSIEEAIVHEVHMNLVCLLAELVDYYLSSKPEILNEILQEGVARLREELDGDHGE